MHPQLTTSIHGHEKMEETAESTQVLARWAARASPSLSQFPAINSGNPHLMLKLARPWAPGRVYLILVGESPRQSPWPSHGSNAAEGLRRLESPAAAEGEISQHD